MNYTLLTLVLTVLSSVSSPDGKLAVSVSSTESRGQVVYSVNYDGRTIVAPSGLGLVTDKVDYTRLEFIGAETGTVIVDYCLDRIKKSHVNHEAASAVMHFKNPDGRLLDVEWHVSDTDVAFR